MAFTAPVERTMTVRPVTGARQDRDIDIGCDLAYVVYDMVMLYP